MFEEIEAWQRRCNQDAEARLYASETNFEFSITVGDEVVMCCVEDGEYTFRRITFGTAVPDVNLVIPPHYWMQFMQATPPPFFNTFNAMRAHFPEVTVEGDELKWAQFVGLIESVLRFARESQSDICLSSQKSYDVSAIVGRYIHFASSEEKSVVYYEESGNGKPIVFLHTAGSDSRQYRYLLADLEMQQNWHMYALDLPYHGKSDPVGQWWNDHYRLTTDLYVKWVRHFIQLLGIERPVIMGSSMAGAITLYLAAEYGEEFSAAISLEGGFDTSGRYVPWTNHPKVHAGHFLQSWVSGLMAPHSPEDMKRLTLWQYAQGGPGVYQGDTYFYSVDWPNVAGRLGRAKCPLWVLTGEYDYSCTPDSGRKAAKALGGLFIEMANIGHFPMSENPALFLEYIHPVLDQILHLK